MTKFITNQNIEIRLELAGLGDRIVAFILDALIIGVYLFSSTMFISFLAPRSVVPQLLCYLPVLFYSLLFEIFANGQTPGKMQQNIKVVRLDGGAPGIFNYLMRWVLRPIDIFLYGSVAILCIIITKNGQRLGDLAAGTTVIKQRSKPSISLSDVRQIPANEGYNVIFPQVKRLNDKQIELIRKTLRMRRDGFNGQATDELVTKVRSLLQIESDMPPVKLLYTIVKDYEHLSL